MIEEKIKKELKEKLEKEKREIEEELEKFAKRSEKLKGNWDTKFPSFNGGEAGGSLLEKEADEVEEYEELLAIEQKLETKLRDINLALEKIKKGKYGICEKCKKEIEIERLKAIPEARFCSKCKK
jgi:DnaK suppressor protein